MRPEPIILLVEDCPDDLGLLRRFFSKAGLRNPLQSVPDGVEAMAYLLGRAQYADRKTYPEPNILLIDINMPRINGLELMSWLRTQPDFEHLVVIALSGSAEQEEIDRAYQMGANSYLLKPSGGAELEKVISAFYQYWVCSNHLPRIGAGVQAGSAASTARQ